MNALVLTLFVSLGLASLLLLGFVVSIRRGDHEHADRLSMMPLDDEPPLPTESHKRTIDD